MLARVCVLLHAAALPLTPEGATHAGHPLSFGGRWPRKSFKAARFMSFPPTHESDVVCNLEIRARGGSQGSIRFSSSFVTCGPWRFAVCMRAIQALPVVSAFYSM